MTRLLILGNPQFGYLNATYYYSRYLRHRFEITYIGWDHGWPKRSVDGVRVVYVSRAGPKPVRYTRFLLTILKHARQDFDLRYATFFPLCSLVRLLTGSSSSWVVDIRSASINPSAFNRFLRDSLIRCEAALFRNVVLLSAGVARRLRIERAHIVPLGADEISASEKTFADLRLLFVGTLYNRRLEDTIRGIKRYLESGADPKSVHYTIVGEGIVGEDQMLAELVAELGLGDNVTLTGRIPHDMLGPIFDDHNVGVSYIPITDYFDHQPVTKTFEYLRSGMPVVATRTSANVDVLRSNPDDGVLIDDNPESFCEGLRSMAERLPAMKSGEIRKRSLQYGWRSIIEDNLEPYLLGLVSENSDDS
ncbi:MAG: glycosyltransferase [Gammaproteobacteria bacterium]